MIRTAVDGEGATDMKGCEGVRRVVYTYVVAHTYGSFMAGDSAHHSLRICGCVAGGAGAGKRPCRHSGDILRNGWVKRRGFYRDALLVTF